MEITFGAAGCDRLSTFESDPFQISVCIDVVVAEDVRDLGTTELTCVFRVGTGEYEALYHYELEDTNECRWKLNGV